MEKLLNDVLDKIQGVTIVKSEDIRKDLAAIPSSHRLVSLEPFADAPERISGTVKLHRFDDFTTYVNDFKSPSGRVFVTPKLEFNDGSVLATAVLDYPEPGKPSWSTHNAQLIVATSLPYKLLTALESKGLQDQNQFALQLRDVARYCSSLSQADLIEIARTLTLTASADFASVEDDFSGSINMQFNVQVNAKSDATARRGIDVPREISFNMPVLQNGEPMDIVAELIYRPPPGPGQKVQMGIRLPDRKFVEMEVLENTASLISDKVGLTVALGTSDVPSSPSRLYINAE